MLLGRSTQRGASIEEILWLLAIKKNSREARAIQSLRSGAKRRTRGGIDRPRREIERYCCKRRQSHGNLHAPAREILRADTVATTDESIRSLSCTLNVVDTDIVVFEIAGDWGDISLRKKKK